MYGCLDEKQSRLKKTWRVFNNDQISVLKESFARDPYPKQDTLRNLSDVLGVHKRKVYNWFYKKRKNIKKEEIH